MKDSKFEINTIVKKSLNADKKSILNPTQVERLKTVSELTLSILGTVGLVSLAVIAPGILGAIGKLKSHAGLTRKGKAEKIYKSFYYLRRSGQIKMRITRNDLKVSLSNLGKKKLEKLNLKTLNIVTPAVWNRKWWLVAADIPTKEYKHSADLFRRKLEQLGFYPLQRTLWLYPFDPRKEISFVASWYRIERFVTVMEVNRLDRDDENKLKSFFINQKVFVF